MENGMERVDIAIIGTGPAGVSAAITAKVRNKSVLLIGSRELSEKMSKAHQILNYPDCRRSPERTWLPGTKNSWQVLASR